MSKLAEPTDVTITPGPWVIGAVLLAVATVGVSSTSVAIVLPQIVGDLGGTQAQYGWLIGTTLLAASATGPVWAALAGRDRHKPYFLAALALFTFGTVLAGTAPDIETLIAIRAIQGTGVGGVFVLANVSVSLLAAPRDRGRLLGYVSATLAAATLGGPMIGGVIDGLGLDWRWNFAAGLPTAAFALTLLATSLRIPRSTAAQTRRLDIGGLVLIPVTTALLLVGVSVLSSDGFGVFPVVVLALGACALLATVVVESRAAEPVIPLSLFRSAEPATALLGSLAVGAFGMVGIFLGQYFQIARASSPFETSLWQLPLVALMMLSSLLAGALIQRSGRYRRTMLVGAVLLVASILGFTTIDQTTSLWLVSALAGVLGLGTGLVQQNLIVAAQNSVPRASLSSATSTATFLRTLGGAAASPLLAVAYDTAVHREMSAIEVAAGTPLGLDLDHLPTLTELTAVQLAAVQHSYSEAFGALSWVCLPLALLVLAAALLARDRTAL
jgi:MFS family permease